MAQDSAPQSGVRCSMAVPTCRRDAHSMLIRCISGLVCPDHRLFLYTESMFGFHVPHFIG